MKEILRDIDEDIVVADGFDDALIGYVERCGSVTVALYDREKCIEILVERDGMEWMEAEEYFEFNVAGSYIGEHTPAFATLLKGDF